MQPAATLAVILLPLRGSSLLHIKEFRNCGEHPVSGIARLLERTNRHRSVKIPLRNQARNFSINADDRGAVRVKRNQLDPVVLIQENMPEVTTGNKCWK